MTWPWRQYAPRGNSSEEITTGFVPERGFVPDWQVLSREGRAGHWQCWRHGHDTRQRGAPLAACSRGRGARGSLCGDGAEVGEGRGDPCRAKPWWPNSAHPSRLRRPHRAAGRAVVSARRRGHVAPGSGRAAGHHGPRSRGGIPGRAEGRGGSWHGKVSLIGAGSRVHRRRDRSRSCAARPSITSNSAARG